jgi:hypothetical protein
LNDSQQALVLEALLGDFAQLDYLVALVFECLLDDEVGDAAFKVQFGHVRAQGLVGIAIVGLELPAADLEKS